MVALKCVAGPQEWGIKCVIHTPFLLVWAAQIRKLQFCESVHTILNLVLSEYIAFHDSWASASDNLIASLAAFISENSWPIEREVDDSIVKV